ncbi:MAG: FAD binding domain-containing protein [Sphingomonas sp.]|nr:FAD binding domain-containing protein [Sphingomonas sp.]
MVQLAPVETYHAPVSLTECLECLAGGEDNLVLLAGGQAIMPLLKNRSLRPNVLVDLSGVAELRRREIEADGTLVLGAMRRHREVYDDPLVRTGWSALADATSAIGDLQVQNRGTIGGNVVFGTVLTDLKQVAMCLDASLRIVGRAGNREVSARDAFGDAAHALLAPDELLESMAFPAPPPGSGSAYRKFGITTNGRPVIGVAASLTIGADGICTGASIVIGGLVPAPCDVRIAAQVLIGQSVEHEVIAHAAKAAAEEIKPQSDGRASAAYRRQLVRAIGQDALNDAWQRAIGTS